MLSHFTVLSNWLKGYDRYTKTYSKKDIPLSTYPDEFYLLGELDYQIGVNKASKLLGKLNIPGNALLRIDTPLTEDDTAPNLRNGLGRVYPKNSIPVKSVSILKGGSWSEVPVEEVTAHAFGLDMEDMQPWDQLKPLTLSFLPVAMACQASCLFCFSSSSISSERKKRIRDFEDLSAWCVRASEAGAKRFVVTGGGEPTIIPFEELLEAFTISSKVFDRNILITNGMFLAKEEPQEIKRRLTALKEVNLSTLSLSFHHYDVDVRAKIMGIDTKAEKVLEVASKMIPEERPNIRIICVLQKGGVESAQDIDNFVQLAFNNNVEQLCFKELYVAATAESLYTKTKENIYSATHQVPLSMLTAHAEEMGWPIIANLPWGSPVYRVTNNEGKSVDIAAYTEPSVGWERMNGVARSWNFMADAKCFASLEDPASELKLQKEG